MSEIDISGGATMLLTVKQTAEKLKVNKNYVYKLINSGLLPAIKIGSIKISEESLDEFIRTYDGKDVDGILNEIISTSD